MSETEGTRSQGGGHAVGGSDVFVTASRIDERRDDLTFADSLTIARLVLIHQGNSVPTRGKRAVLDMATAKRLAKLGLVDMDEGWGAQAGTRDRTALTAAASSAAIQMVVDVLQHGAKDSLAAKPAVTLASHDDTGESQ